jgi:hypothetical protein
MTSKKGWNWRWNGIGGMWRAVGEGLIGSGFKIGSRWREEANGLYLSAMSPPHAGGYAQE